MLGLLVALITATAGVPAAAASQIQDQAHAASQPAAVAPKIGAGPRVDPTQPPSADDTMRAYRVIERWVRSWSIPADADADADAAMASELAHVRGACVTLRFAGEIVGRGQDFGEPSAATVGVGGGGSGPIIVRAVREAMTQAQSKLPVADVANIGPDITKLAPEISISVELAGEMTPVECATWEEAELVLAPGLDGVCVTPRATVTAIRLHAMFPSQMMLTGTLPHRGLAAMIARAIGEGGAAAALEHPAVISTKHGLRFSRFRVTHLAQPSPGREPVFLYRGQRVVSWQSAISRAELVQMAEGIVRHIESRVKRAASPNKEGGTPTTAMAYLIDDKDAGARLPASEQALAVLALRSAASVVRRAGPLADELAISCLDSQPAVTSDVRERRLAARLLRAQVRYGAQSVPEADDPLDSVPAIDAPLAVLAYAPAPEPKAPDVESCRAMESYCRKLEDALTPALASDVEKGYISSMPWLGWAAVRIGDCRVEERRLKQEAFPTPQALREAGLREAFSPAAQLPGATRFREMRALVWSHQVTLSNMGLRSPDMIGGITFTSGLAEGGGAAYPTWQSARPLAFIATMLREPRLTESQEVGPELVKLLRAMRFLRQLQVDDASAWLYPDPSKAIGGIRSSVWDSSQPLDASAMVLLCVAETIRSLDEVSKRPPSVPAAPNADQVDRTQPSKIAPNASSPKADRKPDR